MRGQVGRGHIADTFRAEYGRAVAALVRSFGDIDVAEEAVQEAFAVALDRWPADGVPPNPGAWITTTAKNKAIDRLRRESVRAAKYADAARIRDDSEPEETGVVHDDRLRLIFTCCHPALAQPARVALTLKLLGGLETREIASAFLVPESTVAQRIVRAKKKIAATKIPYRVPTEEDLPGRLQSVLSVLYLIFNEGYAASSGDDLIRADLCAEAIRLTRVLVSLMPDQSEARGLLALQLLTDARREARFVGGSLIPLPEQDRSRWDRAMIAEGHALVRECLRRTADPPFVRPGAYQLQAAINAVHTDAAIAADTDWVQILALYDQWMTIAPTPIVALNRAVSVAEVNGPLAALEEVDRLELADYYLLHSTRAHLLGKLGRVHEAAESYDAAIALTNNSAERRFLGARRDAIRGA